MKEVKQKKSINNSQWENNSSKKQKQNKVV